MVRIQKQLQQPAKATPKAARGRRLRNVALLIGASGSFGRGLLNGIARFNREHGSWSTYIQSHASSTGIPPWFKSWHGDGALALIQNKEMTGHLQKMDIPVVNIRLTDHATGFPYLGLNHARVAELAAEHLFSLGLANFAFVGRRPGLNPGLDERCRAFQAAVKAIGKSCSVFPATDAGDWDADQNRLANWVLSLPKPVGIMACNDDRGLQLLDACRRCGATVPDEVAVVGVDNDEQFCELSIPPLTSIDTNAEQIGYEAAALLEQLMAGKAKPPISTELDPRGIVLRRSTDVIASEDPEVNRAVAFIRAHAGDGINVGDVLAYMRMSRDTLQDRMKKILRRTVHQEIERTRVERAKELLLHLDITIKQVAASTGFSTVQYMTQVFRNAVGETPGVFRKNRAVR